jgi:signal transduction histidine kinase
VVPFIRHRVDTAALAGWVAALALGVWVAIDQITGVDLSGASWTWWVPYGVFLVTFTYDALTFRRQQWTDGRVLVWIEATAATLTYLASAELGWTGVLIVVAAASAAYVLSPVGIAWLVGAQTLIAGVGQLLVGGSIADAGLAMVAFGAFQTFAVVVVLGERRQTEARSQLAAANVELRATAAMLAQSTQLSERLRIARDLHDLVGHQLTALSIELEVASHHSQGEGRMHVERARDTAKELLGDVRAVVGDLRGPRSGLSDPLRAIVDGLPGVEVRLTVVEDAPVGEETAMAVMRCVQEALTNVLKHSGADVVSIEVRSGPDGVMVAVEDDGKGAEPVIEGHGLTGMRERVEGLGGDLMVTGRPGRGLRVEARIPR